MLAPRVSAYGRFQWANHRFSCFAKKKRGMIFRSFQKRNSSQKNTNTAYFEYSYSGIVPKERDVSFFRLLLRRQYNYVLTSQKRASDWLKIRAVFVGFLPFKAEIQSFLSKSGQKWPIGRSRKAIFNFGVHIIEKPS